ncbi:MAG: hypothetical protein HC841_02130 [Verrucomicrobiae bacterium]|nr:hypothetical protein [Verrucomicrobiae bacterium]
MRVWPRWFLPWALLALPAAAQQYPSQARGLGAAVAYQGGDLDHVNLFNGQLSLTLPLGQGYPVGPGLGYGLALTYTSNLWSFNNFRTCSSPGGTTSYYLPEIDEKANAGPGWRVSVGKLEAPVNLDTRWHYFPPDGGEVLLYPTLHPGIPATGAQPNVFFANNGSYLRLRQSSSSAQCHTVPGTPTACRLLEFPSGEVHEFHNFGIQAQDWRLTRMRDRFGNRVDVTYTNLTWQLTDTHGRTQTIRFAGPDGSYKKVLSVELTKFGGGSPAVTTFSYRSQTIERHGFTATPCDSGTVTVDLLDRMVHPDGSFWEADYYVSDDSGDAISGALQRLRIPTGGALAWTYQQIEFPSQDPQLFGPDPVRVAYGVAQRELFENANDPTPIGTWDYAFKTVGVDLPRAPGDSFIPCHHRTTVSDPLGNDTVSYFTSSYALHRWSYGLPFTRCNPSYSATGPFLSQELYEGSAQNGTKVRSVFVEYESDGRDGGEHQEKNHRLVYRKTVYHDDGDRFREVRFSDFDGLGHYRTATTGGNFGSGNVRAATTDFNPTRGTLTVLDPETSQLGGDFQIPGPSSPWVLGTFTESRVTEAGQTAIEEFCFDTTTGFLARHRTLAGASRANGDLLQVMTPAATGHVATELFYGGDAQGAMDNVYANLCDMSLAGLDAQYQLEHTWAHGSLETSSWIDPCDNALELLAVDNFIDQETGFVSVSRDPAGVATIYDFDEMSRPIAERAAQSAWVEIEYTLPTVSSPNATPQTLTQTCNNAVAGCADNDLLGWHRMRYDGLGRPQEEAQRVPTVSGISSIERQFTFNALGWPLTQTAWGDLTKLTTWSDHDRFGRPGQMQLPTESPMRYTYLGERVMTRQEMVATGAAGGETSAYTTEVVDGQGRLEQVCENQSSAWTGTCTGTTTLYEYGVTGAMSRVCQNASGAACGQERRFDVDRRGFLLGEKHPEIGPSGNGWSNYSYDALGNVLSRTIAGSTDFDLDFRYDAAGRLIKLSERNGPNGPRLLKEFFYGRQNNGNDKRAGKLTMSRRHNWVDPVGPLEATGSLDLVVTQSYFYEGRDGRVSKRLTSLKVPSITTYAFVTDFNWHPLGVLSDIDYPECLHPRCSGRAPPRNVAYSYTRGFQTAVPGYASSITYQGGGMLHQVQHTNGVSYTVEREAASAIDRPHRISTNRGLDTGIYSYDGAGNVKQIGTQDFRYDRFKRMTSGEVTVSGQDRIQSATYDVYNNLLSLTTNGSTLTTSVNASTNRLTSVSALYDAAGNLTRQVRGSETHQYTYDPLGMPKYLQSTTDQAQVQLYDADDERLATYDCFPGVCDSPGWELRTTVRGLGGEPLREYSTRGTNGWQWVRDYVYRNGGMLAAAEPDGNGGENVYHFHPDHLGTPRQITNGSGVQVALHSYYPFGQEATDPAQTAFTKKFTGHERDANGTGTAGDLDYMHARYCSPTLGRFLSFDPIGGNPRAPQSWNRYAYALNSPMNYTDPEGLFAQLFLDLYFVAFDEITVTASSYSSLVGYFLRLGYYFSEGVRPSIYGELGRPTPPAAGVSRALLEGDELERVRFGMSYGAIDTVGCRSL